MKLSYRYVIMIITILIAMTSCIVLSSCVSPTHDMLRGAANKTVNTAIDSMVSSVVNAA